MKTGDAAQAYDGASLVCMTRAELAEVEQALVTGGSAIIEIQSHRDAHQVPQQPVVTESEAWWAAGGLAAGIVIGVTIAILSGWAYGQAAGR